MERDGNMFDPVRLKAQFDNGTYMCSHSNNPNSSKIIK